LRRWSGDIVRIGTSVASRCIGREPPEVQSFRTLHRVTQIDFGQFLAVDMRVGRVTAVDDFPEARKPAWKLTIDFGPELGVKRSSAQIRNYAREELEGRLVVAVVNFPPRQIGPFMSEVLTLGASDPEGNIILLEPRSDVEPGSRIH
jgi:tRNA-binding protein